MLRLRVKVGLDLLRRREEAPNEEFFFCRWPLFEPSLCILDEMEFSGLDIARCGTCPLNGVNALRFFA